LPLYFVKLHHRERTIGMKKKMVVRMRAGATRASPARS